MYGKYKTKGIDLLISDIIMPGMNGRELAESILNESSKMQVLYISGYTDDIIATQGVLDKGLSFLAKPFSIFDIASKIRSILDK